MKNKKLLSILLALVLALSLAMPLATSARAEGPYKVGIDDIFNGSVTADKETANEGETVRLTVTPSDGYIIESISVYAIDLYTTVPTTYSEGNYVFTMPASEVQISATFKAAPAPADTEIPSVALSLTLPAAGGSYSGAVPAAVSISSGTGFTVKSANWFNTYGVAPASFEAGEQYWAGILLAPAEGYAFTDDTAVTIDTLGVKTKEVVDYEADNNGCLRITTVNYTIPAAPVTHTVKFAINLGDPLVVTPPAQTVADGEKATEPSPAPEAFGCTFLGWYLGEQKYDFNTPVTGDITLEAKWDIGPEYYYHGIVVAYGTADRYSARIGTVITITANEPAEGKVFDKWVVEGGGITLDDEYSKVTTFEMKLSTVAVKATFKDAPAVTTYPVWVGGTQVTSANKDDILGDGGKAKFDPDSNTLTLDGLTLNGAYSEAAILVKGIDLTIVGSANVTNTSEAGISSPDPSSGGGITLNGDFTITGTTAIGSYPGVTVSGGTLKATATGTT
ncbi:MAG: InlB B-repeat-containing protein, partial [Oscillospiraceae bacterium]|nr:InlB B-repeat-containing protein [Oscillospiraceae bacterium]